MPSTEAESLPLLHVAVGVVFNPRGEVLIALRGAHQHQGNLWEFPGGKVDPGESSSDALRRELKEELGIEVFASQPLIQIEHHYPDKSVLLDVRCVSEFSGVAHGVEGQPIEWVAPNALHQYEFPVANRPILLAINLPKLMAITGNHDSAADFAQKLDAAVTRGAGLVQLRLPPAMSSQWRQHLTIIEQRYPDLQVVVNSSIGRGFWSSLPGLHLTAADLMALQARPVADGMLLGASCHNQQELVHANSIGVDYLTVSPVLATLSHPQAVPLGWGRFAELALSARCPVYALGGMNRAHVTQALDAGGQGIAAISEFWGS